MGLEEKLIEAVRRRTMLYDTSHPDYMKTKLKNDQWEEIAKEIGLKNGVIAKTIWEKLRHSFRDALRRQKKMLKNGVQPESLHLWKLQKEMSFLQPFTTSRDDVALYSGLLDNGQDTQNIKTEDVDVTQILSPPIFREIKKRKTDDIALLQNLESDKEINPKGSKDPLYHFFMSMYETTKRMPPASQFTVRNQIYQAVSEMEGTLLNFPGAGIQIEIENETVEYDSQYTFDESLSGPSSLHSFSDNEQQ